MINFMCIRLRSKKKDYLDCASMQMCKPHTHKLYILTLWSNIVYIFALILQMKITTTTK